MRLPSGDQATSLSALLVNVICLGSALPSFGTIQRSAVWSFSSYAGLVTEKTVHLPSGLGDGAATRFISHITSCVRARLAGMGMTCALAVSAASASTTVTKRMCRSMRHIMAERQTALITGASAETDLRKELEMIQVNIVALTELTKLLLPGMVARRRGRILNVASTAAFQPGPLMAVYYATKAYVLSFSEAIAEELRETG